MWLISVTLLTIASFSKLQNNEDNCKAKQILNLLIFSIQSFATYFFQCGDFPILHCVLIMQLSYFIIFFVIYSIFNYYLIWPYIAFVNLWLKLRPSEHLLLKKPPSKKINPIYIVPPSKVPNNSSTVLDVSNAISCVCNKKIWLPKKVDV